MMVSHIDSLVVIHSHIAVMMSADCYMMSVGFKVELASIIRENHSPELVMMMAQISTI
jgi:hypothetical protein